MLANVVVVADIGDSHGDRVISAIADLGASATRITASLLPDMQLVAVPGSPVTVTSEGANWEIDDRSTVWWRRPGTSPSNGSLDLEERLVKDEIDSVLPGILAAAQVRWVDAPWSLLKARLKPLQLATAHRLGVNTPRSVIAGSDVAASQFANNTPVVAKAVSSGWGIAPFVDVVPRDELWRISNCPTLLQELVSAEADLRIVTVGGSCFAWQRPRDLGSHHDWRAVDPAGQDFVPISKDPTTGQALAMADALGLSFSVQDWLWARGSAIFLEVNAQGQWIFLEQADSIVVSALAKHLVGVK